MPAARCREKVSVYLRGAPSSATSEDCTEHPASRAATSMIASSVLRKSEAAPPTLTARHRSTRRIQLLKDRMRGSVVTGRRRLHRRERRNSIAIAAAYLLHFFLGKNVTKHARLQVLLDIFVLHAILSSIFDNRSVVGGSRQAPDAMG
ncbi:hypothetical protein G6F24_014846 [Rhizopus arrhizus]|nr:hypothetical protein G6F24_014846 [Rhizopus arrhizus]